MSNQTKENRVREGLHVNDKTLESIRASFISLIHHDLYQIIIDFLKDRNVLNYTKETILLLGAGINSGPFDLNKMDIDDMDNNWIIQSGMTSLFKGIPTSQDNFYVKQFQELVNDERLNKIVELKNNIFMNLKLNDQLDYHGIERIDVFKNKYKNKQFQKEIER